MNLKFIISAITALGVALTVSGQKNDTIPWTGKQLIEHGIKLYDKGNYDESLKIFNRVSKCDPDYSRSCYEMSLVYQSTNEFAKGLIKINEADSLSPNEVQTITMKGSLLDDLDRRKEAIDVLESAVKKWPYNHLLLYNLAIVYVNVFDYQKAEQLLTECVKISPYHSGTHLLLGRINYFMGRKAQAVLAYNMGLTLNPTSSNVTKFEKIITGKVDPKPKAYIYPYDANFDANRWNELTRFCNSGIAFRKDFPYNANTNFLINRISYLLFQKMEFIESDTTIYNQFYVQFFKEILNRNEINVFFNYQLQNIDNKEITSWNKANNDKQAKFIKFAQTAINEWREYEFSSKNQKNKIKTRLFDENGKLDFIGTQNILNEPSKEGHFKGIDNTGFINEKGTYVSNNKTGPSTLYWPNGAVKQELNFVSDKLDGMNKTYYDNSKLSGIYPRKNGKQEGTEIEYLKSGRIFRKQNFVNDLEDGSSFNLYHISGWQTESNYKKGKLDGPYIEKWINGQVKTECNYVDSLLNGTVKKWYSNGKIESVNESKNDYLTGPFTTYHTNGVKNSEGTYNDSAQFFGSYTEYYRNGVKKMNQSAYLNGKRNGVHTDYYLNGNKKDEYFYENDKINKVISYNQQNNIQYQATSQNGLIAFKYFYDDGVLKREGNLLNGKRDGEWREYSGGGIITSHENWKEDMQFGAQKTFFESGSLKTEYFCDSNLIEGAYRIFFPNGKLKSLAYYHKGKGTGDCVLYYSTGKIQSEFYLIDNEICGRRFDYMPNGILESITEYNNDIITKLSIFNKGKLEKIISYTSDSVLVEGKYPNGKLKYRFTLVDGLKQGVSESYYPNGKISERQEFLYGKLNGPSKVWDLDGNLVSSYNYILNKIEGYTYVYRNNKVISRDYYEENINQQDYREYYPNGSVFRIIPYVDDEREGEYSFFSPDSVKLFSLLYNEGSITSIIIRNKQGNVEKISVNKLQEGLISSYYPTGNIAATVPLVKGYLNGTFTLYYANGNKIRQRDYVNDYLEGLSTDYYANGKVKSIAKFINDDKNGEYILYNESGIKIEEGNFDADTKTGKWTYYDITGKPKSIVSYENDNAYEIK